MNILSNRGAEYEFDIEKGTYCPVTFYAKDVNGDPLDLTGYAGCRMTIRTEESETATALVTKTGTISAPAASNDTGFTTYWKILFSINAADTNNAAFSNTSGYLKAELLDAASRPIPLAYGRVTFRPEVDQQ